ncbi:hypothetical protein Lal_00042205 [Lupinus albus]|nr:hypothetical protein Lal_00042205 [Lupinus albus]
MALNKGAKFEVEKFNGTRFYRLWQRQVEDMLAQQGQSKVLCYNKLDEINQLSCEELKELVVTTICLSLSKA